MHVKSPGPLRPYPGLHRKFTVAVGKCSGNAENVRLPWAGAASAPHAFGMHVGAAPFHDATLLPDVPGTLHVRVLLPLSSYPEVKVESSTIVWGASRIVNRIRTKCNGSLGSQRTVSARERCRARGVRSRSWTVHDGSPPGGGDERVERTRRARGRRACRSCRGQPGRVVWPPCRARENSAAGGGNVIPRDARVRRCRRRELAAVCVPVRSLSCMLDRMHWHWSEVVRQAVRDSGSELRC